MFNPKILIITLNYFVIREFTTDDAVWINTDQNLPKLLHLD